MKAEKIIHVHTNPHGKKRLSIKGKVHPEGVKYIRADLIEQEIINAYDAGLDLNVEIHHIGGAQGGFGIDYFNKHIKPKYE